MIYLIHLNMIIREFKKQTYLEENGQKSISI